MANSYTARGTGGFYDVTQNTTNVTFSVTVGATGSTLVVGVGHNSGDDVLTAVWNGASLTLRKAQGLASTGLVGEIWSLDNATAGTGNLVVTLDNSIAGYPLSCYVVAAEIVNAASSSYDASVSASGNSTSPTAGTTSGLSQSSGEMGYGIAVTAGPVGDTAGTWSNGFTAGQRVGSALSSSGTTISEGWLVTVSNSCTYGKTGITSRAWRAVGAAFKNAVVASSNQNRLLLGIG